jgi:hypothetical protein
MVDEGICRLYPVFRLLFRPFVSRLQMRFDARYIRQASRRHGGLGLLSCIERTVSRAYARYKKKLFCSWSCNRPNHVLYYFMWGYEMTFKKKIGRNSEGVWIVDADPLWAAMVCVECVECKFVVCDPAARKPLERFERSAPCDRVYLPNFIP